MTGRLGVKDSSPRTRNKEAKLEILRNCESLNRNDVTYKELAAALGQSVDHTRDIVGKLGIPVTYVPTTGINVNKQGLFVANLQIATWRQSSATK